MDRNRDRHLNKGNDKTRVKRRQGERQDNAKDKIRIRAKSGNDKTREGAWPGEREEKFQDNQDKAKNPKSHPNAQPNPILASLKKTKTRIKTKVRVRRPRQGLKTWSSIRNRLFHFDLGLS
jgi:hypothetical protein